VFRLVFCVLGYRIDVNVFGQNAQCEGEIGHGFGRRRLRPRSSPRKEKAGAGMAAMQEDPFEGADQRAFPGAGR
jgi:hypothetical protein